MGYMTAIAGVKKEDLRHFVLVPFYSKSLRGEARDFWEKKGVFRTTFSELADDITTPEKTVLYVLAHSGRDVSYIAGDADEKMSATELVDELVGGGLPPKILAIKIWACFSGVNGFAMEVKAKFIAKKMGYNPIVVGYNEVTGGPYDQGDQPHKHVFQEGPHGARGDLIGRASQHRSVY
jgi:hypothetical protein